MVDEIIEARPEFIFIDRTFVLEDTMRDRLCVQTVPPSIYKASYPAWMLSRARLLETLSNRYAPLAEFESTPGEVALASPRAIAFEKAFIWRLGQAV